MKAYLKNLVLGSCIFLTLLHGSVLSIPPVPGKEGVRKVLIKQDLPAGPIDYDNDDSEDEGYANERCQKGIVCKDTEPKKIEDFQDEELSDLMYQVAIGMLYSDEVNKFFYAAKRKLLTAPEKPTFPLDTLKALLRKTVEDFLEHTGIPYIFNTTRQEFANTVIEELGDSLIRQLANTKFYKLNLMGDDDSPTRQELNHIRLFIVDKIKNILKHTPLRTTLADLPQTENMTKFVTFMFSSQRSVLEGELKRIYQAKSQTDAHGKLQTTKPSRATLNITDDITFLKHSLPLFVAKIREYAKNQMVSRAVKEAPFAAKKAYIEDLMGRCWAEDKTLAYFLHVLAGENHGGDIFEDIAQKFTSYYTRMLDTKQTMGVKVVRPILPRGYVCVQNTMAEFFANMRLVRRSAIRYRKNLEEDLAYKALFDKDNGNIPVETTKTVWELGGAYSYDDQTIYSNGSRDHMVVCLGSYKDIKTKLNRVSNADLLKELRAILRPGTFKLSDINKDRKDYMVNLAYLLCGCEGERYPGVLISTMMVFDIWEASATMTWEQAIDMMPMSTKDIVSSARALIGVHNKTALLPYNAHGKEEGSKISQIRNKQAAILKQWIQLRKAKGAKHPDKWTLSEIKDKIVEAVERWYGIKM